MNSSNASNYDQRIERADLIGQQFSHNHNLNGNVAGSNMFPSIGMPSNIPYFQENAPPHYNYIIAEVPYHDPVTQVTESREFVEMHTVTGRGGTSRRMETSHSSQFVMQPENGNICQIQTMRGIISTTSQNASSAHFTSSSQLRNVYPFETVETTPEYGFSTQYTTSSQMMNVCQYQMDEHPTFNTQVPNPYSSPFVALSQSSSLHQSQTRTYTCTEADSLPENVHELQTAQAVSKNMNVSSSFMAHEVQERQLQGRHTMNRNVKGAAACSRKRVVSGFGLSDKQQMKTMRVSAPRVVPKNIKQRVPPDHNGSTHITDQTASTSEKFHSPVNCGTQPNLQTVEKFEPLSWTKTKPPISYAQRLVIEDDLNKVQQCHPPVNCYTQPHPEIVYELEPIRWTQTKPMISYAQRMVIEDNINHAPDLDKSRYSSKHNSKDFSKSQVSHGIGTANYTKLNTPIVIELSDSVDDDIVEICPSTSTTTVSKLNHLDIQAHSTSGLVQDIVNEHALQHEIVSSTQPCDSPLNKKVKTKRTCKVRDAPVRRAKKSMQVSDESSDGSYKLKYVSLPKRVSLRKKETPFYMEFSSSDESNKNVKNRTNVAKANIGLAVDPDSSGMMVRDQSKNETEEIADHSSFGAIVETLEGSSTNTLQNKKANSSKSFSKNIYDTSSDEFTPFEKNIRKKKTKKKVRASTETVRQKRSEDTSPHLCEIDAEKSEEKRSSARQKNATSYLEMSSSDESYIEFPKIRLRIVDHCNSSDDTVMDPSEPHLTDRLPIHSKSPSEDHLKANINGRNKKTNCTVDAIEVDGLSDEYLDNGVTSEPTTTPISENRHECFTRAAKAQEEASCTSRTAHSEANGHIQNCDTKSVEAISNAFSGSEEVVREETIVRNRKNRTTLLGVFAEYSSTEDEEYEENKRKIIESSRFKYLLDCDEDELNELLFDIPEINVTGLKRIEAAQESKTVPDQKNTPAGSANQLKTKEVSHKATNHKLSPEKAKIASTSSVSQTTIAKRPNRKGKVVTCSANDENPYAKIYAPSAEYRRRSAVSKDRTTSSPISKECPKTNTEPTSNVNSAGKKKVLRKKASAKKENICDNALSSDDSDEGPKTTNRKPSPIIRKPMNMRRCARLDAIKELRAGLLEKTKANVGVQEEEAKATSKLRPKSKPTPPSESDSNSGSKSKSKLESESESEESDSLYKPARGAAKKPFVFLQDTSTDESYSSDPPSAPSGYATECSENAVADVVFEGIEVTFPKSEEKEIEKMLNKVSRSRFKSLLAYKEKNLSRVLRYVPEQNVRGLQRLKIEHADVYARICKSDKPDFEIPIEMACDSTWNRKATKNMILEYVFSNFQFTAPREMVLENFERDFTHMVSVKELKFVTSVRGTIWYYHFRSPRASLQDHLTLNGTEEELAAFFKTEEEEVTDYSSNESCDENGINPFQIRKIRVPPPVVSSSESEYVDSSVDDDDIGDFNGPARLSDELKPLPRKQVKKNMKKHLPADPDLRTPQESDFNKFLMYSEIQLMEALERLQEVDVTGIPRFDPPNLDIVIELTNHPPRFENAILEALDATPTGIGKLADIFEYIISRYHFNLDIPLAYEYVQDALKLLVNCKYLELHGREGKLGYRLDKAKKPKGVFIPGNLFLREAEIGFINGLREALTKFHTPKGNFMQTLFIDVAANNWCENNMERSVSIFKGMTRLKRRGEVRETKKGRYILTKKYRKFYWKRERRSKRSQKRRKP